MKRSASHLEQNPSKRPAVPILCMRCGQEPVNRHVMVFENYLEDLFNVYFVKNTTWHMCTRCKGTNPSVVRNHIATINPLDEYLSVQKRGLA